MYCTHMHSKLTTPPLYTVAPDQFNALSSSWNEAVSSLPLVKCAPFSSNTAMTTVWQHPSMQTTALCISAVCHFQRHLVHQLLTRAAYSNPLSLSKASLDSSENRKALKLDNFDILGNFKMAPSRLDLQKTKGDTQRVGFRLQIKMWDLSASHLCRLPLWWPGAAGSRLQS